MESARKMLNRLWFLTPIIGALALAEPGLAQPVGQLSNIPPPFCLRRLTDDRPTTLASDRVIQVWFSVKQASTAVVTSSAIAQGKQFGTLDLKMLNDGLLVARAEQIRGTGLITAKARGTILLLPGRQYNVTVKPLTANKQVRLVDLQIEVSGGCS